MKIPYQIRQDTAGYYIVRPVLSGGCLTIAGPYLTRCEAESEARRRWAGKRAA